MELNGTSTLQLTREHLKHMLQKRSLKNKSFPVITFKDGVLKKKKKKHWHYSTLIFLPSGSKPGSTKNSGTNPSLNMTMVHLHAQKRAEMSDHCLMVLVAWMLHCSNSRQAEGKVRRGGFGKKKVSEKPKMWKQKFWKYILYVKWLCSCLLSDTISVHSLQEHFLQVVFFFFL